MKLIKMKILFLMIFIISLSYASDGVVIDSPDKFEVIKVNKLTKIFKVSKNGKSKKEIFSKILRDDVKWIYSSKGSPIVIIITRPMIAGEENSRFWARDLQNKVQYLGQTSCKDHQIDGVNAKKITYRCFKADPKNPLNELSESNYFKINIK